jgi:hypothetical protein
MTILRRLRYAQLLSYNPELTYRPSPMQNFGFPGSVPSHWRRLHSKQRIHRLRAFPTTVRSREDRWQVLLFGRLLPFSWVTYRVALLICIYVIVVIFPLHRHKGRYRARSRRWSTSDFGRYSGFPLSKTTTDSLYSTSGRLYSE